MGAYDEIEIEDMTWNEELQAFTYSCPCGDLFQITLVGARRARPPQPIAEPL
jgi:diphthamide biosynthesis protein 3